MSKNSSTAASAPVEIAPARLAGAYVVTPRRHEDERGFFARTWSDELFRQHGLATTLSQCSVSFNTRKGTLRGMHFQAAPYGEVKLVRCTMGSMFDVAVDLRLDSPTYRQWTGIELSANNRLGFYIPDGCAHGFVTLEDNTEVLYQISGAYVPEAGRGVRWNDPAFGIEWPLAPLVMAARDRDYPDYRP